MSTIRESFYDLTVSTLYKKEKESTFINIVRKGLEKVDEIKLPMQLFESIFNFDFHRGVKHPISSNIVKKFRKQGLKVSKVRNYYLVRIRKRE
ncbi:hypothetical protein LCGC14_2181140 [marine sediment metagenome]|uniref:Uncharacterized protein n=1 Tax=marine sediment metagenome TaxID=412755 RepID=A0A0F9DMA3_9ZZZZ